MATTPPGAAPPGAAPAAFEITTQAPRVSFLIQGVQPPSFVYMTKDDALNLGLFTVEAGTSVRFTYRFLRSDGVLITGFNDVTGVAADSSTFATFQIDEGYLLSVGVELLNNGISGPGHHFVLGGVLRSGTDASLHSFALFSQYISSFNLVGWPVGVIRSPLDGPGEHISLATAVPGAGAEITQTVLGHELWRVRSVRYSLTTSAAVATRRSTLQVTDGVNVMMEIDSGVTQAAGVTVNYDWIPNYPSTGVTLTDVANPLPGELRLPAGWVLRTNTAAIQGGDQYTAAQLALERWIRR